MKAFFFFFLLSYTAFSQVAPYDVFPEAKPPYYRVRYEASDKPGELQFAVKYTVWIHEGVKQLKGVIVHQHGCGEGSCKSGLTGAWDLHWQALAKKHDCALMAPSYEQPQKANCQLWCDPRNGSGAAFRKSLKDLAKLSGHPELATVPWAIWGHSGGGHWAGGMSLLDPERMIAVVLRSGVPLFKVNPDRKTIKPYQEVPKALLEVPILCNPGTKEGVTVKKGKFTGVWPANEAFLTTLRAKDALVGGAIDPLAAHECGNSRYMTIAWLDACLSQRLPAKAGDPLRAMSRDNAYLHPFLSKKAMSVAGFQGDKTKAAWIPNKKVAHICEQFV